MAFFALGLDGGCWLCAGHRWPPPGATSEKFWWGRAPALSFLSLPFPGSMSWNKSGDCSLSVLLWEMGIIYCEKQVSVEILDKL